MRENGELTIMKYGRVVTTFEVRVFINFGDKIGSFEKDLWKKSLSNIFDALQDRIWIQI